MRIRQIKPSWFLDKELRRGTTADAREFYIGLWMLADDAGYLIWDEERVAAELYPFDQIARRERNVAKWSDVLERLSPDAPHLVVWDCGHACVPKMPGHQRIAGTRTDTVQRVHEGDPKRLVPPPDPCKRARSRVSLQVATSSPGIGMGSRNGTVGNGTTAGARVSDAAPGGLKERVEANGFDPAVLQGGRAS